MILALGGLIVLSPILILVALMVRASGPGPVIYKGLRVGKGKRRFTIYKFRTMLPGAEEQVGARLLTERDQLLTTAGRVLRELKLDELPQLVNVLKGEMSLVGPRPVRPIFLQAFEEEILHYAERFRVPPGITGLAQLRGNYYTSPRNKLRYERLYVKRHSVRLDLAILSATAYRFFARLICAPIQGIWLWATQSRMVLREERKPEGG